ncbi:TonB-dependent receptor [Psychrobium sp. nBUS_13]|uniref:TonB-dependent receptor n=1 Tax=Psychrobium sp. nBUS_13 TaxID=3395319 RepID=UPI003EBA6E96
MKLFAKRQSALSLRHSKVASAISIALGSFFTFNAVAEQTPGPDAEKQKYEKIVVTGQKISRTLQETPASIAVFSVDKLAQQNLGEISEVLFEAANVHSTSNGSFNIRGIDAFNVSGSGSSALASVYVDGAAFPERLIRNGFSTWDANQIEILRGPQSTLQGRNALAGAIVLTTTAPSHEWNGKYRIQVGENGEQEVAIAAGGSLIEDQLAFRFSAENENFDGYNYNITRQEDADFKNEELYRLKFLYTPSVIAGLSAQLSFTRATTDTGIDSVDVPLGGDPYKQRIITNNDTQSFSYETDIMTLEINYPLSDVWSMTSVSTYSDVTYSRGNYDSDNGPESGGTRFNDGTDNTLSQEFRLTFNGDKLTGLIGAYYFEQDMDFKYGGKNSVALRSLDLTSASLVKRFGLAQPTADYVISQYSAFDPAKIETNNKGNEEIESSAIFADFNYEINEQWNVFTGFRWDRETQDNASTQSVSVDNIADMPNPSNYPAPLNQLIGGINAQLVAYVDDASKVTPLAGASFNEIIPKLGVSYMWNDDLTTSVTFQKGYRSGGVGVNTAKSTPFKFDSESTTNYEFSLRSFWLDGDLMLNANAFYVDWKDQQVNVQLSGNSFDTETKNAGSSKVKGFELEAFYQLSTELELSASIGQAKTQFTDFVITIPTNSTPTVFDLTGRSFADSPELTANLGATYENGKGIFASISANYAESSNADTNPYITGLRKGDIGFDLRNDSRTLVNMKIGYEWDSVGIYLIGKNILDKEYISGAAFGRKGRVERHSLGNPRQISLSLQGAF